MKKKQQKKLVSKNIKLKKRKNKFSDNKFVKRID